VKTSPEKGKKRKMFELEPTKKQTGEREKGQRRKKTARKLQEGKYKRNPKKKGLASSRGKEGRYWGRSFISTRGNKGGTKGARTGVGL